MFNLNNIKIKPKLIGLFLLVGLVPLILVGWMSQREADKALMESNFNQLEAVRQIKKDRIEVYFSDMKKDMANLVGTVDILRDEAFSKMEAGRESRKKQIERYFGERYGDIAVLAANDGVRSALEAFTAAFEADGGKTGGTTWNAAVAKHAAWLEQYNKEYGYHDLFLISKTGDLVYSAARESDLGANLVHGPLQSSGLGRLFVEAQNGSVIKDFEPYAPSKGAHAAFIGAPIKREGQVVGVVALQLPEDTINAIVQERNGLGKTGEYYLVGQAKGHESSYRSNRVVKKGTIGEKKSDPFIEKALNGETGDKLKIGSSGDMEVVTYAPIKIKGLNWVIIGSMNAEEAFSPKLAGAEKDYFSKFMEEFGYYDLFLINTDGLVFYSVSREADYKTNMLNGEFASSNLGALTRQVLESGQFGIADFQSYAPSKGAQAAFIAQPIKDHQGKVDLVVALQVPDNVINRIMQERSGMGETGETYLVPDRKSRFF